MIDIVRINELCRELQVKARTVIEYLPQIGVTDKKTHSSSVSRDEAAKVREHFKGTKTKVIAPKTPLPPILPPQKKPRRRFVTDTDGTLGIAKGIASRFGEELCEEEFFE